MEGEKKGNSLEQRLFKDAKFKTYYIRAGKLQRKLSLNTISLLFRSILGFFLIRICSKKRRANNNNIFRRICISPCLYSWAYFS